MRGGPGTATVKRFGRVAIVGLSVLTALVACDRATAPRELQGAVVFLLDTVRPDHLSSMGHSRPTSPELARLADQGVVFEQVVSYSPWTLPSVVSMLSGSPSEAAFDEKLERSIVESIRDADYATAGITEGGWVSTGFGIDLGFDYFRQEEGAVQILSPGQLRDPDARGGIERTFRSAREWIAEHRDERFFLFVHTYEPHVPYTRTTFAKELPRGGLDEIYRMQDLNAVRDGRIRLGATELEYLSALYDGGIRESDRHVGEFLKHLEDLGLRDRTLIVVTSDHGEGLGDHFPTRAGDHGHALYDDQVLVPLILHNPLEQYEVRRIRSQVRTMDIFPTIAELLDVPVETAFGAASLVPLMRGEETGARIAHGGLVDYGPPRRFVRWLGYKYIEVLGPDPKQPPLTPSPPAVQLFDLTVDPDERNNLAGERVELVGRFHDMLQGVFREGWIRPFELSRDIDEPTRERLRSLGYLQQLD